MKPYTGVPVADSAHATYNRQNRVEFLDVGVGDLQSSDISKNKARQSKDRVLITVTDVPWRQ